jgi:hypothetical protein
MCSLNAGYLSSYISHFLVPNIFIYLERLHIIHIMARKPDEEICLSIIYYGWSTMCCVKTLYERISRALYNNIEKSMLNVDVETKEVIKVMRVNKT